MTSRHADDLLQPHHSLFFSLGVALHAGQGGHGHSHGHGHGGASTHNPPITSTPDHSQPGSGPATNINVRAAFIHVLGDLIQSIGVLIAAYIIRFYVRIVYC